MFDLFSHLDASVALALGLLLLAACASFASLLRQAAVRRVS